MNTYLKYTSEAPNSVIMAVMKKIVIEARSYSSSTGRYVRKLIEYLEKIDSGSERKYIVLLTSSDYDAYTPRAKNFSKLRADFEPYTFAEQTKFLRFCRNLNADLIHFTMPQQPVFYKGAHITTVHDLTQLRFYAGNKNRLIYELKRRVGAWVFSRVGKTSEHIIAISKFTKNDYLGLVHMPDQKISVIYESADPVTNSPAAIPALVDKSFILYVGQQSTHKNIRRLIQAHQQLLKNNPSLLLVLAGKLNAQGEKNKQWVKDQQFKNVHFTGFVSDDELGWLYENCKSYIFPSLAEGFGLPGLEAMQHQAPVVSSSATCLPEIYGNAAHYFNPKDVDDMAHKINEVLTDETLRSKLIKNGQQQLKKYSWQKMAEQTLAVYTSSLKTK